MTAPEWVVLVEAAGDEPGCQLGLAMVEQLLECLADQAPCALYAPDRYAIQMLVAARSPEAALAIGVSLWRQASEQLRLEEWDLVRAEVKTIGELASEELDQLSARSPVEVGTLDAEALEAAYLTTRALIRVTTPAEAAAALSSLAHRLGGTLVPARHRHPDALPVDLSFGAVDPLQAVAHPASIARLRLEQLLPRAVEDAWQTLLARSDGDACDGDRPGSRSGHRTA